MSKHHTDKFMGQMESGHLSVQQQLTSQASETVKQNVLILKSTLRATILCGKQSVSLRGHREISNLGESSTFKFPGSVAVPNGFWRYGFEKNHFARAPRNAQY